MSWQVVAPFFDFFELHSGQVFVRYSPSGLKLWLASRQGMKLA